MLFEELLTELRESHGLTQDDVANAVSVTRPTYDTLVRLARFYGITTDYLLGASLNPTPPPEIDPPLRRLIDCYCAADSRGQDTISEFALRESLRYGQI